MKIAFTTGGNDINAPMEQRFGRSPKFLIYDTDTNFLEIVDNRQNVEAAQGAGIQAAETLARQGIASVVTGHCGPKAFQVLSTAGIRIYSTDAATVAEALKRFNEGSIKPQQSPDVEEHWR